MEDEFEQSNKGAGLGKRITSMADLANLENEFNSDI